MVRSLTILSLTALLATPAIGQAGQSATVPKQAVVSEYAACVLKRSPERARELLATQVGSTEERTIAKSLMVNMASCTNGRKFISMRTGEARGALAEAVLKSDAQLAEQASKLAAQPADRPTETEGRRFVMAFARCLTAQSPVSARALIGTEYGSAEEKAAMLAFDTALKDCMPTGLSYSIDVPDVRNHVATALYDRAMASSGRGDPNA
jgi:hypothetical protein